MMAYMRTLRAILVAIRSNALLIMLLSNMEPSPMTICISSFDHCQETMA